MRSTWLFLPVVLLLALTVTAQEDLPAPAPQLKKLDVTLGNWEGSGTIRMEPEGPKLPWTSKSTARKILGGHFIQEDMTITTAPGAPPIVFRSVMGWDRNRKCYVSFSGGNEGSYGLQPFYFTAAGKMVSGQTKIEKGHVVCERWVSEYGKEECRFSGERSVDGGPFFVFLEGSTKRGGDGFHAPPEIQPEAMEPPSDKVKAFAPLAGVWDFKGWMKAMPDAPRTEIAGTETVLEVLGGHVYRVHVQGKPFQPGGPGYEAESYLGWDPTVNGLQTIGFNNMGEIWTSRMYGQGKNKLVYFHSGVMHGVPMTTRGCMNIVENGDRIEMHSDTLMGEHSPMRTFEGTFTRAKKEAQ